VLPRFRFVLMVFNLDDTIPKAELIFKFPLRLLSSSTAKTHSCDLKLIETPDEVLVPIWTRKDISHVIFLTGI
jgi:hypothetical protein